MLTEDAPDLLCIWGQEKFFQSPREDLSVNHSAGEDTIWKKGRGGQLCLRRDAFEEVTEAGLRMKRSGKPSTLKATTGEAKTTYFVDGFTEKNVTELRMLMEHAKLWEYDTDAIEAILDEETAAFFEGERSAAEVAEICHNRVQLYLDENLN